MTKSPARKDGNHPAALTALADAISALAGPQKLYINGELRTARSLYMQLRDEVAGQQGSGHGVARSLPPVWIDAIDLLNEIDTAVEIWQPAYRGAPATIGRLRTLQQHSWRPQDTHSVEQITRACREWAQQITSLLEPQHVKHVAAPCPVCSHKTALRRDSAGELVRVPALQIITNQGCTCMVCKATWTPDYYLHLCRVLGFDLPPGVLE